MTINNMISGMIFIVLIIFLTIFTIDSLAPFYKSADFRSTCAEYNQIIIKEGRLTTSEVSELRTKLEAKDMSVLTIDAPTSSVWGDSFTFEANVSYTQQVLKIDFTKETKVHKFKYKKTGVSLRGGD